ILHANAAHVVVQEEDELSSRYRRSPVYGLRRYSPRGGRSPIRRKQSINDCGSGNSGNRNSVGGWLHNQQQRRMRVGDRVEMG
ncbi:unnamed protein product, partial [Linum tenue]